MGERNKLKIEFIEFRFRSGRQITLAILSRKPRVKLSYRGPISLVDRDNLPLPDIAVVDYLAIQPATGDVNVIPRARAREEMRAAAERTFIAVVYGAAALSDKRVSTRSLSST